MKLFFALLFLSSCVSTFGQITISGKVINEESKEPIAGANVFINNTSYKTITTAEGKFEFTNINLQKGELIVNALGYKYEVIIIGNKSSDYQLISLKIQTKELDEVLVRSYEKDGYKKWGQLFYDNFIGRTEEAINCKIENQKALKFFYNKKINTLSVIANDPLKIVNNALGYRIDYTLESFEFNTKYNTLFYSGYAVFTEMKKGKKQMQQWKNKRKACYQGSIMHFMRALYRNNVNEEAFTVQRAIKVLNVKKDEHKKEMRQQLLKQPKVNGVITLSGNSLNYNKKLMDEPDSIYNVTPQRLATDSFAFKIDSVTAGMFFENSLVISYKYPDLNKTVYSFVKLLYPEPLNIFQNGSYYTSMNFFTESFWAEHETVSRMLPIDFVYEKPIKQ